MLFPVTLWTGLLTFFVTSTSIVYSHNYPDYDSLAQYSSQKGLPGWTALEEERSNYRFNKGNQGSGNRGKIVDLSSWPESDTLSRQIFGDKSADSAEPDLSLDEEEMPKSKRESHSLSIVNPLDVLRQRLMLEMARRKMKENQDQIRENALILKNLGKRSLSAIANLDSKEGRNARTKQDYLRRIHESNSEEFEV